MTAATRTNEVSGNDNAQSMTAITGYPQFPQVYPQALIGGDPV
jgi:hypothetical protein